MTPVLVYCAFTGFACLWEFVASATDPRNIKRATKRGRAVRVGLIVGSHPVVVTGLRDFLVWFIPEVLSKLGN
jgi:hypothetical protein